MAEVDVFADGKALRVLVGENGRAGSLGLADGVGSPGVIEENIVNAAGVPSIHAVGTAEA